MRPLRVRALARHEIDEAFDWYAKVARGLEAADRGDVMSQEDARASSMRLHSWTTSSSRASASGCASSHSQWEWTIPPRCPFTARGCRRGRDRRRRRVCRWKRRRIVVYAGERRIAVLSCADACERPHVDPPTGDSVSHSELNEPRDDALLHRLLVESVADYAIYAMNPWPHPQLERRRGAAEGIHGGRNHRAILLAVLQARRGGRRRTAARARNGRARRTLLDRGLAGAQGWLAVLGARSRHGAARGERPPDRVCQDHARPHRTARR